MLCKRKIEKRIESFLYSFRNGYFVKGSPYFTLSYDRYLKILYLLNFFGLFQKGGGGKVLKVSLDIVNACNEECHSILRIYLVIIYYRPVEPN